MFVWLLYICLSPLCTVYYSLSACLLSICLSPVYLLDSYLLVCLSTVSFFYGICVSTCVHLTFFALCIYMYLKNNFCHWGMFLCLLSLRIQISYLLHLQRYAISHKHNDIMFHNLGSRGFPILETQLLSPRVRFYATSSLISLVHIFSP